MFKKFLATLLIVGGIFFAGNSATVSANENFQPLTAGNSAWDGWETTKDAVVVNCREWISLRSYPSTYADRLTTIPLGAYVTVYNEMKFHSTGLFIKVYYRGMTGWCLRDYISIL